MMHINLNLRKSFFRVTYFPVFQKFLPLSNLVLKVKITDREGRLKAWRPITKGIIRRYVSLLYLASLKAISRWE